MKLKVNVLDGGIVEVRSGPHAVHLGESTTIEACEAAAHLLVERVTGFSSADVIAANDPLCHGVLLLGLDASEEQVARSFEVAAGSPVCRGFAIGRTIFGGPAREWFAGEIDDAAAVARVAAGYARMIEAWRRRRPAAAAA